MRDIKFRAWDKYNEIMLYSIQSYTNNHEIPFAYILSTSKFSVMQYTGLKDKNSKEIYEGDIVLSFIHPDIPLLHKIEWSEKFNGWFAKNVNNKGSEYKTGDVQLFVYVKHNDFKVISNIYENPELSEA